MINNSKILSRTPIVLCIIGVLLFIIGFSINLILANYIYSSELNFSNSPILEKLISFSPLMILIVPLVLAPIIEEITFRGWIRNSKKSKLTSFILSSFYVLYYLNYTFISFLIIFILFFTLFKLKKHFLIINIISTSILFGIIHINNFNLPMIKFASIIQLIGLAFILSFIVKKFGLIYSIICHFLFNIVALAPLLISFGSNNTISFENESYHATLNKLSIFNSDENNSYYYSDSIDLRGHLSKLAIDIAPFEHKIIYVPSIDNLTKYNLKIKAKKGKSINNQQLFLDYLNIIKSKTDTLKKKAYLLSFDSSLIMDSDYSSYNTSLFMLVKHIDNKYNIPILLQENQKDTLLKIDLKTLKINDFSDFKLNLQKHNGVFINKSDSLNIKYIKIKSSL